MALLEVACFNAESAAVACEAGVDRIELCDGAKVGGTTPSAATVLDVVDRAKAKGIPVYVMIRPRGGDFTYTDVEFAAMKASIRTFKPMVDGFVFGILKEDSTVDVDQTAAFVKEAHPLPCTFHRAFDDTPDLLIALDDVISTGCSNILTSGGAPNALSGADTLRDVSRQAEQRIDIIIGGGVRSSNLASIRSAVQAAAYHTSALLQESDVADHEEITKMEQLLGDG